MNNSKIQRLNIGEDRPCFIISEISGNHLQNYQKAERLVLAACESGVDCVKLQTYTPDTITLNPKGMTKKNQKYFRVDLDNPAWNGRTYYDLYKQAYTPWEWYKGLKRITDSYNIKLFSTPSDDTAVDFLEEQNVPAYKIASFDVINIPLLKRVAKTQKQTIMSTGMASLKEIKEAYQTLKDGGSPEIILLHCISAYPSKYEELNLRKIGDLKRRFNCIVGFSDHTLTIDAPAMAVYMGARVIEKHITFKREEGGPDSSFSLEPEEFKGLVKKVREIEKKEFGEVNLREFPYLEKSIGSAQYGTESQTKTARPSIWAQKDIWIGEIITKENVKVARPGNGLAPIYYERIIGQIAKRKIERGTPLSLKFLK